MGVRILASIESLCANTGDFKAWMFRCLDLLVLVIRCWHPERQPAIVNQCLRCEFEDVVQHSQETVRSLRWDIFLLSVPSQSSTNSTGDESLTDGEPSHPYKQSPSPSSDLCSQAPSNPPVRRTGDHKQCHQRSLQPSTAYSLDPRQNYLQTDP